MIRTIKIMAILAAIWAYAYASNMDYEDAVKIHASR